MYNVSAIAIRKNEVIEVTVTGMLPDTCHQARIKDIYPGGNIVYVVDPGEAQVFIEETVKPGSGICLFVLMPWGETVKIPDDEHDTVGIYVNGKKEADAKVVDETSQFIVIALVDSDAPNFSGCSIIPEDSVYPAIYKQVHGPASLSECSNFVGQNCTPIDQ